MTAAFGHDFQVLGPHHQLAGSGIQIGVQIPGLDLHLARETGERRPASKRQPQTTNRFPPYFIPFHASIVSLRSAFGSILMA